MPNKKKDREPIKRSGVCNFKHQCTVKSKASYCCEIVEASSNFFLVAPQSSYRISHCIYHRVLISGGDQNHICSCPERRELYWKRKKNKP
jgi:hypothetical protein